MAKKGDAPAEKKRRRPARAEESKGAVKEPQPASSDKTNSNPVAGAASRTKLDSRSKDGSSTAGQQGEISAKHKAGHRKKQRMPVTCPVVGIGASAGGLEAFKRFFAKLPTDSGMAYVLIQHLDPNHQSLMADLLSNYTDMPVVEVTDGTDLQPNRVYMIPPNKYLRVKGGRLLLDEPVPTRGMRMPIDYFFRSLAEARKEKAIAVILSGTGSDGTLGAKEIKGAGGLVVVESVESAQYDGMPRSAISAGIVDFILPIEEMPSALLRYATHPYLDSEDDDDLGVAEREPDDFRAILSLLRAHTDYDFRCYKKGTLNRRIQRRMGLRHVKTLSQYLTALREDNDELRALFHDLLIGVTRFFREQEAWNYLADEIYPSLVARKPFGSSLRIWVPGCSTGEEAYSHAMLAHEEIERQKKGLSMQIFGTDLDPRAVGTARAGSYPATIAADVNEKRLRKFFVEENERLRVVKRLREPTVFAVQNLVSDPPFSNLDVISCRNLMIYLEPEIQNRLLEVFHFALAKDGVLFLGSSETLGRSAHLFKPLSAHWRIYRKKEAKDQTKATFPIANTLSNTPTEPLLEDPVRMPQIFTDGDTARKLLLDRFAPAAALVDRRNRVKYFHGPIRNYLEIPSGEATLELPSMTYGKLRNKLRSLLHRCWIEDKEVSVVVSHFERNNDAVRVEIVAEPVRASEQRVLVVFRDLPLVPAPPQLAAIQAEGGGEGEDGGQDAATVEQVRYELQATREDLQSTIEELETSNEELKASNEEVMSMNEELQSTNEELETSREELQSLNEELSTVNNQLEDKVEELDNTNNDLQNLIVSTQIATVFLDDKLRIRRFTPAAKELLNIIDTDVGRPISDLAPRVTDGTLLQDARQVMRTLVLSEQEVQSSETQHFLRRIRPYRTADNHIEGVVVTYEDVSSLVRARDRVALRERQHAAIAKLGRIALEENSAEEIFTTATRIVRDTLQTDFSKLLEYLSEENAFVLRAGSGWDDELIGKARVPAGGKSQAGYTLSSQIPVVVPDLDQEKRFEASKLVVEHDVASAITVPIGPMQEQWGVLGADSKARREFDSDDVTFVEAIAHVLYRWISSQESARELAEAAESLRETQEAGGVGTWDWDLEHNTIAWSAEARRMLGIEPGAVNDASDWLSMVHPKDRSNVEAAVQSALAGEVDYRLEFRVKRGDGKVRWLYGAGKISSEEGEPAHLRGVNIDITERVEKERELSRRDELLRMSMESGRIGVWEWDVVREQLFLGPGAQQLYGVRDAEEVPNPETALALVHEEDRDRAREEAVEAALLGRPFESEFRVVWPDGSVHWLLVKGDVKDRAEDGRPARLVGVLIDITARKLSSEALSKSEKDLHRSLEELEAVYRSAPVGLCVLDSEQRVVRLNEAMAKMSDLMIDQCIGKVGSEVLPQVAETMQDRLTDVIRSGNPYLDCESISRFGAKRPKIRYWLTSWLPLKDRDGNVEFVTCVVQDITERKRAEKNEARAKKRLERQIKQRTGELEKANVLLASGRQELRELTARLIDAQEDNYRRVARDLHDGSVQSLGVVGMRLHNLKDLLGSPSDKASAAIEEACSEIERLSNEIHAMARQLHPAILDDLGLPAALREITRSMSETSGIDADFTSNVEGKTVTKDVELALYRAAQELLANVSKHSQARNAHVSLNRRNGSLTLRVADDGKGFDPQSVVSPRGIGLVGVRERIRLVGGTMEVESKPGEGTWVEVRIPKIGD